ncbi:MAG: penicillin-binding protein 2 [Desulfobacterota bacterium]|nr:penicillin-binding protein 2 [Thermodesulfobacteriota bacterium]
MVELDTQRMEVFQQKGRYLRFVVAGSFLLLFIYLWYLQVIRGAEFRQLSENNRIRIREVVADRGMLMDRHGHVLAHNRPSFDVFLIPEDIRANPDVLEKVGEVLQIPQEELREKMKLSKRQPPFRPVKVKSDIDWQKLVLLETNRVHLPGILVDVRPIRAYHYGPFAAHLLGYIGEVDENELNHKRGQPYRLGSMIGKYGVEYGWEAYLKGVDGGRQIEVDALGREIRHLRSVEPFPGHNIVLTIDFGLQKVAEEAFQEKAGALVAMDPKSGRILAMVSRPAFDPSIFARGISPEEWKELIEHPFHPLRNKTIQGQYPPGSVLKIVTAIAGLETGAITPQTQITCTGAFPYGNRDFRCWKEKGHGTLNLHQALVQSCDVYFYQVGLKVGVDAIAHYAAQLGLGRKTGIALPHEKPGTVPTTSWKKRRFGVPWYSGETLSVAVGQGYMNTTPLQLATLISAVANGGRLYLPQVVERVENIYGEVVKAYPPLEIGKAEISETTLRIIQEALWGAVNEPGCTGGAAALKQVKVAGKTGTAQVVRMAADFKKGDMNRMPLKLRDHAWFVAYAPFEDPKIAVAVLVEHGGYGGAAAAPIAKRVIAKYFGLDVGPPPQGEERAVEPVHD